MPAFSLTPIASYPQVTSDDFPNPLRFALDGVEFTGPIELVDFLDGTVTESDGTLSVTLGGGAATTPALPTLSLQYNQFGAFGGTSTMLWHPQSGSTEGYLNVFSTALTPANTLTIKPAYVGFERDLLTTTDPYRAQVYLGTRTFSNATYVPTTSVGTLDRPALWVGGPYDNSGPTNPAYDAWYMSDSIVFAVRIDQATYTRLQPLDTTVGTVLFPESYDATFMVTINGTSYKVPLIAS